MSYIKDLIKQEKIRQNEVIRLIPSENYVSQNILDSLGSNFINKYAEGYPNKRYYQGQKNTDLLETYVKDLALKTFKLDKDEWRVNVQVLTGSVANLAVYNALLEIGDKILAMSLYDGGHLSHGWKMEDKPVSFTSKIVNSIFYYVDKKTGKFNYEQIRKIAIKENPKMIVSGGTAYPREINHKKMSDIAKEVGAYYLADIAHEAGLVAAEVNNSPFQYADIVTMTTRKTLRGPIGAMLFSKKKYIKKINQSVFPGLQGGPQMHTIAAIGLALEEANTKDFIAYQKQTIKNAKVFEEELIKYDFNLVSGGTDKHLLLIDLRNKKINATEFAKALEEANIIVNKNTVPGETGKPWDPSGIRIGTPSITTKGFKEEEIKKIAKWIYEISKDINNIEAIKNIKEEVIKLNNTFKLV